ARVGGRPAARAGTAVGGGGRAAAVGAGRRPPRGRGDGRGGLRRADGVRADPGEPVPAARGPDDALRRDRVVELPLRARGDVDPDAAGTGVGTDEALVEGMGAPEVFPTRCWTSARSVLVVPSTA